MTTKTTKLSASMLALVGLFGLSESVTAVPLVRNATGADAASIQAALDLFRADLGANNGLGPCVGPGCAPGVGRREVNWDAVPDSFSSGGVNPFPGNFFNLPSGSPAGRVRGIELSTSGAFEVSANAASGVPILFGNHVAANADDFAAFSPQRIFGLVGTNQMDVLFSIPGDPASRAGSRGFGVVFTDVEVANLTKIELFDINDLLLHSESAPAFPVPPGGDTGKSFSFVGVSFTDPVVARVRITNGDFDLDLASFGGTDAAAMDDFIFGEPGRIPEPSTLALLAWLGIGGWIVRRRIHAS